MNGYFTHRVSRNPWLTLLAMASMAISPLADAQNIWKSHSVYHVQVCPGPAAPDTARCHAHVVTDSKGVPLLNQDERANPFWSSAQPARGGGSASTSISPAGYWPSDLRSAYGITGNGSSMAIAIVDAYGYPNALNDLNTYRNQFGLGALPSCSSSVTATCFAKYNQKGQQSNYPQYNNGWAQETALDLQMASAMCPACKIILVEASSATYSNLAAAEKTAMNLGANVISNSYGGSESGTSSYNAYYSPPSGVTVTVSSGDSGYGVEFPASSPNVTAVGGTSLTRGSNTRGWSETVWSDAGSGCSTVYAQPIWQKGLSAACGSGRSVADTSAVADPYTGVAVYAPSNSKSSAWMVFGGTSVGAPLIGGIYAVGKSTASPTNNADSLYLDCTSGANCPDINDVVSGSNGNCGGSNLCAAAVGYDGPSGLGTPNRAVAFH